MSDIWLFWVFFISGDIEIVCWACDGPVFSAELGFNLRAADPAAARGIADL
jgi:hypothetical protein